MEIFFGQTILTDHLFLSEDESHHCVNVLRKNTGDIIQVIDGKGHLLEGPLEITGKKKPVKVWIEKSGFFPENLFRSQFNLAIAPTKNTDRMEWMVEKTVELGIQSITFLTCEHSERTTLRVDRLEKIAIAALKQSKQYWLPNLTMPVSFKSYIDQFPKNEQGFIAHCYDGNKREFGQIKYKENTHVLIGPEGDFSELEIEWALNKGIQAVSLGASRLRTETAAMYSCSVFRLSATK